MTVMIDTEEKKIVFMTRGTLDDVNTLFNSLPSHYQDFEVVPFVEARMREVRDNINKVPFETVGDA